MAEKEKRWDDSDESGNYKYIKFITNGELRIPLWAWSQILEPLRAYYRQGEFRGTGDNDVTQNDMRHLMDVLGLSTHARPESPHEVFVSEVIPKVIQLKAKNKILLEAIRDAARPLDEVLRSFGI